jgi:Domain of unknown function (DUF397)
MSGSAAVGDVKERGVAEVYPPPDGTAWRKSRASGASGNCVEVALTSTGIWVRDTKDRPGPVLRFTELEWDAFLQGVRAGEFDLPAGGQ